MSFEEIESKFCDEVKNLMDKDQLWCLNIEELYNKTEVHSINTSKGDAADVGIFSDNSQTTVFEFMEAAELAYQGWGNSLQKAIRLYSKHLSEEIKSYLINISDNYNLMKTWLINTYGGPSRIDGDVISNLSRKPKPVGEIEKINLYSILL